MANDTKPDQAAELSALKAENELLKKTNAELSAKVNATVTKPDEKEVAKAELARRSEITALCKLAKVDDAERDLFLSAGFSRAEAQDYLKSSGKLSAANPPLGEGGNDPAGGKKDTPDEKFGKEYDDNSDVFMRQGVSRFDYINSRRRDDGLVPHVKAKSA